ASHGAGRDCGTCHAGPGTGSWGGTQNWVGGNFSHSAATTCIACHSTQRPDLVLGQEAAASLLPGNFDHAVKGADDCFSCHQATIASNIYGRYFNSEGTLPGGDWAAGVAQPGACLDCHASSAPVGFVGHVDPARSPASGAMKHDAVVWSGGARTAIPVISQECALCHLPPPVGLSWATSQKLHLALAT